MTCFRVTLAATVLGAFVACASASDDALVNYSLKTMRGFGKCTVELENAPMRFFHETFDGRHDTGFATSPQGKCRLVVHLSDPIELHTVIVSFFGVEDLGGVDWTLSELDGEGEVRRTVLTHRTTLIKKPDKVALEQPARLKDFSLEFTKLLKDLTPAPKGRMAYRIGEINLLVPKGPIIYVATPWEKWLFDSGYFPFEAGLGREIEWTGWVISADGKRECTVERVRFSSSDPKVAVMDGAVMKTLKPGETVIRAVHPLGLTHEVPVKVFAAGQGGIDLNVIRITRLVLNEKTGEWEILSRRGWKQVPIRGDKVRYRAEVVNLGQDPARGIAATWVVDGKAAETDRLSSLAPAGRLVGSGEFLTPERIDEKLVLENVATFELDTVWQEERQSIGLTVSARVRKGERGELNPDNNTMTIASDALCFTYFTTELGYHRFTNAQQEGLKAGGITEETKKRVAGWGKRATFWIEDVNVLSSSIYDYIYRTCRAWNEQCAISRFPLTPNGITTWFRPKVVVIRDPDSAGRAWGQGGGRAAWSDEETDVTWGWMADRTFGWTGMDAASLRKNYTQCGILFFDPPMMHEASHAHGLVDLYICPMKNNEIMWCGPDGKRLWPDDRYGVCNMRMRWTRVGFIIDKPAMMDGGYTNGYSEHSAYTMERMATKRGRFIPCNNCSGNVSFGDSFNEVAVSNILELWTVDGRPVVGAKIELSKREDRTGFVDEEPEIVGTTDKKGQFNLGNNPVDWPANTAPYSHDAPFAAAYYQLHHRGATGSDHAAIRITTPDGKRFYKLLNSFDLNLAYWYKYGFEPNGWPISTPKPYSAVVISFTIDPSLSEQEAVKMVHSGEVPTFGVEPPWEDKYRPDYEKIQGWRRQRDAAAGVAPGVN